MSCTDSTQETPIGAVAESSLDVLDSRSLPQWSKYRDEMGFWSITARYGMSPQFCGSSGF